MMTLELPAPVSNYFLADRRDGQSLSECFTEDAVVKDEGRTYHGRLAIKEWRDEVAKKFEYTIDPFACETQDGKTVVTGTVAGNFPGSPVDLRFFFELEGDKIAALEVLP